MLKIERHPSDKVPKIERSDEKDTKLVNILVQEIEDAISARRSIEATWVEARRQYSAIPKRVVRDVPVPNAPNIEVPVGAILADDLYASAIDTLFTASPIVTARAVSERFKDHAKATQTWIDRLIESHLDLRCAVNTAFLDDTQLGTAFYYIPFEEYSKKTKTHKITRRGPRIIAMSPEDVILMPGSRGDIQADRWVALRFWYTPGEMALRSKQMGWKNTDKAVPTARVDMVRMAYEQQAKMRPNSLWRELYEVIDVHCSYDYDGDGEDEDLLVTFDRQAKVILDLRFQPYDKRPIEVMRFQLRSHLPYGIGVMEMAQPFQEETTELHCANLLNVFLANARVFVALNGAVPENLEIYPGKVIQVNGTDVRQAFQQLPMSEINPSAAQSQTFAIGLAERRVGTNGSQGFLAKGGSRTPGVTALSLLQQVNRRFAPAFNDMRDVTAAAIRQCIQRIRERILAGDKAVEDDLRAILSEDDADLVLEMLKLADIDKAIVIEFTASNASTNREADRQNALLLSNLLDGYYRKTVELMTLAVAPDTSDEVRKTIQQVVEKGTEIMDRTIRTFDQVRDPRTFLLDVAEELDNTIGQGGADFATLIQQLAGGLGGGGPTPLPEPGFSGVA